MPGSPVKGQKNGSFLFVLAWKATAVFWKSFLYKSFFQVQPWASAVSSTTSFIWCFTSGMPSSRKWSDLGIRKKNQSRGQVKTQKVLIVAISKRNFLWCNSLDQDKKVCLGGWDGSWDVGGWRGWLPLCFSLAQWALHCKASKTGLLPPLLPRQTHMAGIAWLQG